MTCCCEVPLSALLPAHFKVVAREPLHYVGVLWSIQQEVVVVKYGGLPGNLTEVGVS